MKIERRKITPPKDEHAMMDLPFKLIVMIILIGAVIPSSVIGYRNISRVRFEKDIEAELNDLVFMSRCLSREGNSSSCKIEVDLDGNIFASIDHVQIGSSIDEYCRLIRYRFSWKRSSSSMIVDDPSVKLTSPQNSTLRLSGRTQVLYMTHLVVNDDSFILISKNSKNIDLDQFY